MGKYLVKLNDSEDGSIHIRGIVDLSKLRFPSFQVNKCERSIFMDNGAIEVVSDIVHGSFQKSAPEIVHYMNVGMTKFLSGENYDEFMMLYQTKRGVIMNSVSLIESFIEDLENFKKAELLDYAGYTYRDEGYLLTLQILRDSGVVEMTVWDDKSEKRTQELADSPEKLRRLIICEAGLFNDTEKLNSLLRDLGMELFNKEDEKLRTK